MFQLEEIQRVFKCDITVDLLEEFTNRCGQNFQRYSCLKINNITKTDKNIYFNGTYISGLNNQIDLDDFILDSELLKEYLGISNKNILKIEEVFSSICAQLMI